LALLALALMATGCLQLAEKPTATPNLNFLYSDDFTDTSSGWDRFQNETGVTDYANVGYVIYIKKANVIKWANPSSQTFPKNVSIEVDVKKKDGPADNAYGIICRYQNPDNFYYFYVSSDGFGGIGQKTSGRYRIISSPDARLTQIEGVKQGAETNHLRADCIDDSLNLYVNETQVLTATNEAYTDGNVGLIVRTYDTGGVDILFNNFQVNKPEEAIP
jgi:hypothetical protein